MIKLFSSIAMAAFVAGLMAVPAQAQGTATQVERSMQRGLKRATAGEPAKLHGAMTQAQARRVCQTEMAGARESKSAMRTKMNFCINEKMQGN